MSRMGAIVGGIVLTLFGITVGLWAASKTPFGNEAIATRPQTSFVDTINGQVYGHFIFTAPRAWRTNIALRPSDYQVAGTLAPISIASFAPGDPGEITNRAHDLFGGGQVDVIDPSFWLDKDDEEGMRSLTILEKQHIIDGLKQITQTSSLLNVDLNRISEAFEFCTTPSSAIAQYPRVIRTSDGAWGGVLFANTVGGNMSSLDVIAPTTGALLYSEAYGFPLIIRARLALDYPKLSSLSPLADNDPEKPTRDATIATETEKLRNGQLPASVKQELSQFEQMLQSIHFVSDQAF